MASHVNDVANNMLTKPKGLYTNVFKIIQKGYQKHVELHKYSKKKQAVGLHFTAADHIGQQDVKVQDLDIIDLNPDSKKATEVRLRLDKKMNPPSQLPCPAWHEHLSLINSYWVYWTKNQSVLSFVSSPILTLPAYLRGEPEICP